MYLDHYQLKEKPFLLNTDPRFLWLGHKHKEALAIMKYGVQENKGLLLLTGEIGSGKTMLISAIISLLDRENVVVAKLPDPGLERKEFFFLVARSFGISGKVSGKESFTEAMDRLLASLFSQGQKALLIIDEAQVMTPPVLEQIRLLSNMEYRHTKLLNIFMVGQNEFNLLLLEPGNRSLRERITTSYNLELLSARETAAYISHRLKVAGTEKKIFTDDALREIHVFSNGSPRQINIICDIALVRGFEKGVATIGREIIQDCKERVRVPLVPGRPLADELLPDETQWPTPDILSPRTDVVALLNRTIRRMTWYGALALLILLPSGFMLYSDRSRAFLSENFPLLKEVLPTPTLSHQQHTSSLAPSPLPNNPPEDTIHSQLPTPEAPPKLKNSAIGPAVTAIETPEKQTGTSSGPVHSATQREKATETTRPEREMRPQMDKTQPAGSPPPRAVKKKQKKTQSQKAAVRAETVRPSHQVTPPEMKPSTPGAAARPQPAVTKPTANRAAADDTPLDARNSQKGNQDATDSPPTETPDPSDVIKWLIQEKDKSTP